MLWFDEKSISKVNIIIFGYGIYGRWQYLWVQNFTTQKRNCWPESASKFHMNHEQTTELVVEGKESKCGCGCAISKMSQVMLLALVFGQKYLRHFLIRWPKFQKMAYVVCTWPESLWKMHFSD